nr:MAG TPA: hypothetical protein [Caudoviricetes sp.]
MKYIAFFLQQTKNRQFKINYGIISSRILLSYYPFLGTILFISIDELSLMFFFIQK